MLSTSFLSLTLLFSAFSYNAWLEKFRTSLHQPKGVQFSITITQNELNTISLTSAFVEMQDSSKMAIDMEKEAIIVIGDTIKTFNKITKKLNILVHQGVIVVNKENAKNVKSFKTRRVSSTG